MKANKITLEQDLLKELFDYKDNQLVWNKQTNKWQASIFLKGILKYLGSFINEQDARNAYLLACNQHHVIQEYK